MQWQWQLLLHPPNPLHPLRPFVLDASAATINAFAVRSLDSMRSLGDDRGSARSLSG